MRTGLTDIARAEARHNEAQVLAESALVGERRAARCRLAMFALFGVSEEIIGPAFGARRPFDWPRIIAVVLYFGFVVGALIKTARATPSPRRAFWIPLATTLVDFSFMTFVGLRDYVTSGYIAPEMGAIAFAIVMSFSIARTSWLHIAVAAGMAIVCFLCLGLYSGQLVAVNSTFVIGGFVTLGLFLGVTNHSVHKMFADLRRRDSLSRFLPQAVVERVLASSGRALAPVQREVTILFSDIRGFTAYSESVPPREVLAFLDDYFGRMAQVVKGHDGMVNKFLGDGMMAVWGVPDVMPDHATAALRAALDMRTVLAELNVHRAGRGEPPIRIGIGIHSGTVAAGTLGGADQHEYTVIGDAVNVASRIEGMTKELGVDILVSERAWQLGGAGFRASKLAAQQLKGRSEPVTLFALEDRG